MENPEKQTVPPADDGQGGRGDLNVALHQEREARRLEGEARRRLQEENARLRAELAQASQKLTTGKDGKATGEIDLSEFELTDAELVQGDASAVNQKLRSAVQKAYQAASENVSARMEALTIERELTDMLSRYAIFNDEDAELRADAMGAAIKAVEKLPQGSTLADIEEAVKQQARRYSRYKAQRAGGEGVDEDVDVPPLSGGAAAAAHLPTDPPPAKTWEEGRKLADSIVARFAKKRRMS